MEFIVTPNCITKPFVNNLPFITFSYRKIKISVPASLLMIGFCCIFLHDTFNVGVSQRMPNLIWHTKLYVYTYINYMNNGHPIVQKLDVQYK